MGHWSLVIDREDIIFPFPSPIPHFPFAKLAMFSQIYYVVRSRSDGRYLTAHPQRASREGDPGYLLLFNEHFEALSYLNTHGADVADRFGVESVPGSQVKNMMSRWGFAGVGIIKDPLLPSIEFFAVA